jgi:hypothetical protein
MKKPADDDLEDDSPDPTDIPTRDLNRQVRRLAAAVLVQAVLDSRLQADCHRQDAAQFLYPQSEAAREHLRRMAELAGLSPAWLNELSGRLCGDATSYHPQVHEMQDGAADQVFCTSL